MTTRSWVELILLLGRTRKNRCGTNFSTYAAWIAHDKLKELKQTGMVFDYVKTFASLLLYIKGRFDEDKLSNFISGLNP